MAVTVGTLTTRFPEFTTTDSDLITASIADAELMVDRVVYGGKADMAVTYYAAHLIATNPLGEMARLEADGEGTNYLEAFDRVKGSIGVGFRVI